jgi:hypothetical protein
LTEAALFAVAVLRELHVAIVVRYDFAGRPRRPRVVALRNLGETDDKEAVEEEKHV